MKPTLLVFSQVYVPDPTALGQHLAGATALLAARGFRVVVITARNGYEDPDVVYAAREERDGVEIVRLPFSSFGKKSIAIRLVAQVLFLLQAMVRGMFVRDVCAVLVSTSPPACGVGAAIVSVLRRVPLKYWVMDLNPDQLVQMKLLPPKAWPVKLFDFFNRVTLRRARDVIVLDRFMGERVNLKVDVQRKLHVMPPWPLSRRVVDMPHAINPFRERLQLAPGQRVLMYSGNHTAANPLTTLLDAVERLCGDGRLVLACIGGGAGKAEVDARVAAGARNIVSMPYQPLQTLDESLSAADVHVVSIGSDMVGIVHPCKIYGAMAVSRPVLVLGPQQSHLGELVEAFGCGWHVAHGDTDGAVRVLRQILDTDPAQLRVMGRRGANAIAAHLNQDVLAGQLCDVIQRGVRPAPRPVTPAPIPARPSTAAPRRSGFGFDSTM